MSGEDTPLQLIDDLDISPQKDSSRVIKDLLAGTAGGISQVLVGQPFDTTKVRLQTSTNATSAMDVVRNLLKNEGLSGFYKGTLTPLIGVGACVSIQFGVNEAMKRYFRSVNNNKSETLTLSQYYTSGLVGGVVNSFLASPIEHVRIRLQTQTASGPNAEFQGPLDCIRKLRAQGGLMRGLTATMVRESHGCGTYFLVYEALVSREVNNHNIKRVDIPAWKLCLFGAFSGTTLWMMVYPLDVIKSVIQTDNIKNPKHGNSIPAVARSIYGRGGLSAFFKGFGPTMLRAAPANGATFATFELFMRLMG